MSKVHICPDCREMTDAKTTRCNACQRAYDKRCLDIEKVRNDK